MNKLLSMDSYFDYVCKKLSTDTGQYYLWSIYLIQLIRWIHLILKPNWKNTIGKFVLKWKTRFSR